MVVTCPTFISAPRHLVLSDSLVVSLVRLSVYVDLFHVSTLLFLLIRSVVSQQHFGQTGLFLNQSLSLSLICDRCHRGPLYTIITTVGAKLSRRSSSCVHGLRHTRAFSSARLRTSASLLLTWIIVKRCTTHLPVSVPLYRNKIGF